MKIPFCDPAAINREVADELRGAYDRVMARGQYIRGAEVEAFESEWANYCGVLHCVGVGNGTDALTLMLRAYGIGPGDEVIVPSNTFIATWMAVSNCGATPVPVEPLLATFNIDPRGIEAAINSSTVAVLATHLYGGIADMAALRGITDRYGMALLVDACQAHGAKGRDLGDAAAFSFYPTKNLGALGDGGAVVTSDTSVAAKVRLAANYGSQAKDRHLNIGTNSRLDELQAAFLRAKLPKLAEWNERRSRNAGTVDARGIGRRSANHLCVILRPDRDAFRASMLERGIGTMVHYPTPPHMQPAYSSRFSQRQFPIAERLSRHVVSLPAGPELADIQAQYVAQCIKEPTKFGMAA